MEIISMVRSGKLIKNKQCYESWLASKCCKYIFQKYNQALKKMSDIQEHETLSLVYVPRIHGTGLKNLALPCFSGLRIKTKP